MLEWSSVHTAAPVGLIGHHWFLPLDRTTAAMVVADGDMATHRDATAWSRFSLGDGQ